MDMTNVSSSTSLAMAGKTLLTHWPLWPCRLNSNGLFMTLKPGEFVTDSTSCSPPGSNFCPCNSASRGLWSKVSIGLTPPFMKSWMTRLALGAKCGSGRSPASRWSCLSRCASARPAKPPPTRHSMSRLLNGILYLIHEHELVAVEDHSAGVRHPVLLRIAHDRLPLRMRGLSTHRQLKQSLHLRRGIGAHRLQPLGQVLALPHHERVVEHRQRLDGRH